MAGDGTQVRIATRDLQAEVAVLLQDALGNFDEPSDEFPAAPELYG
jgi:hypothetical protein